MMFVICKPDNAAFHAFIIVLLFNHRRSIISLYSHNIHMLIPIILSFTFITVIQLVYKLGNSIQTTKMCKYINVILYKKKKKSCSMFSVVVHNLKTCFANIRTCHFIITNIKISGCKKHNKKIT